MRKYSSNLHSLIGHPGEGCAWFLALIMEPVNQLEKCQGEQTEGSEISQETSSNLTEEDGPSHEMKIDCGTPCPSCCGWKTWLHKFTREKSMEDWPSIRTHRLYRLGRVPKEESPCTSSLLMLFRCLSLTVAAHGILGQTDLGLTLGVSSAFWKVSEERWEELCEVSGEVCYSPVMYY